MRFDYMGRKNNNYYEFPLKLEEETYKYSLDRSRYELFSIVEHRGKSLRSGHYFSYVKKFNSWFSVKN